MPADIRIHHVQNKVRVTDPEALLAPEIMERIVQTVSQRIREEQQREREREEDSRINDRASRVR